MKIKLFILLFLLEITNSCLGKKNTENQLKSAAQEIMLASKSCALITQDENGISRVRTMDPFTPEADFVVWFGTNSNSSKVEHIKNNPNVTLYYLNPDNTGYVTIQGTAEVVNDPQEKESRWKEEWKNFYPNRPEGYLLIKVSPKWMEVVSEKHGIIGDSISWKAQRVTFD